MGQARAIPLPHVTSNKYDIRKEKICNKNRGFLFRRHGSENGKSIARTGSPRSPRIKIPLPRIVDRLDKTGQVIRQADGRYMLCFDIVKSCIYTVVSKGTTLEYCYKGTTLEYCCKGTTLELFDSCKIVFFLQTNLKLLLGTVSLKKD